MIPRYELPATTINLYLGFQNIAVEVSSHDPFFRFYHYYDIVSLSVHRNVEAHHQLL